MIVINEVTEVNTIWASYERKVRQALAKGNIALAVKYMDTVPDYVIESAPYIQAVLDLNFEVIIAADDQYHD